MTPSQLSMLIAMVEAAIALGRACQAAEAAAQGLPPDSKEALILKQLHKQFAHLSKMCGVEIEGLSCVNALMALARAKDNFSRQLKALNQQAPEPAPRKPSGLSR